MLSIFGILSEKTIFFIYAFPYAIKLSPYIVTNNFAYCIIYKEVFNIKLDF